MTKKNFNIRLFGTDLYGHCVDAGQGKRSNGQLAGL